MDQLFGLASKAQPVLIFIGLIVLVIFRRGSMHGILVMASKRLFGGANFDDPKIQSLAKEIHDLQRFSFLFGPRFATKEALHRFIEWRELAEIDIEETRKAGSWIDLHATPIKTKPVPKNYILRRVLALMSLAIIAAIGVVIFTYPNGAFYTRETSISFMSNGKSIRNVWNKWTIDQSDCKEGREKVRQATKFSDAEASAVCEALLSGKFQEANKTALKEQLFVGVMIVIIALIPAIFIWLAIISAEAAEKIQRRIKAMIDEDAGLSLAEK